MDNILEGKYDMRFSKEILNASAKLFRKYEGEQQAHTFCGKPELYLVLTVDRLRNQFFLEGIMQDNQCLINCAYDLDRFIIEGSFHALVEVAEHIEEMVESPNFQCEHNLLKDLRTWYEKLKWLNFFEKETKGFKFLYGWNSFALKNKRSDKIPTWKDSDQCEWTI